MKDYYGIDAGLVVSIESSEKVKSILLFLLFFAITIIFIYFSILYFISNGFSNYIVVGIFLSCLCVLFCIFYLLLERALLHKDLKCKAPLIEPNLRRNLGKWST